MPNLQAGDVRCQRVRAVDEDLASQVPAGLHGSLRALPRRAQGDDFGGRDRRFVGRDCTKRRILRVIRVPNTERDVMAAVTPRTAQRAADIACSDNRDLYVGLLSAQGAELPQSAHPRRSGTLR
ncbi:hypothetical protein MNVI_05830 [Mycobacterium noviomagense]|uniref:Uncharacterized protein n=1 Tax=Mycobacterium noviomagense TaxID=459858 RepID=A0A7I7P9M9_9MYCO|nr:hypothetical protein MNVI_05830 [Mycobacterium noviomagense]